MRNIWFIISVVLITSAVILFPVSAKIQYTTDVKYDALGTLTGFGEEIPVTLVISPGENDVKDLTIDIREADALIDDTNPQLITKTISPAGAAIPITLTGHTFSVPQLLKGQTITIAFNAYPKTLRQQNLHVADIGFSYTQLGDKINQPYDPINAKLDNSPWFNLQKIQDEVILLRQDTKTQTDNAHMILYSGIVLIIVAFLASGYFWMKQRESVKECADLKVSRNQLVRKLLQKVELAESNPAEFDSLKSQLRSELSSTDKSVQTVATTSDAKKTDVKNPTRDHKGGFE